MGGEDLKIHRVVAKTFLGPPPSEDAWQVHHNDGNPGNNHIVNLEILEYVTQSHNTSQSHARGRRRCGGPKLSKPVMYRAVGSKDWTRCPSLTSAAELDASVSVVSSACRHMTRLKGYEFSLVDLRQLELPGEEWRQVLCPMFCTEVLGRTVSSLGRVRTQSGRIHYGCIRSGYLATRYTPLSGFGSRSESVHRLVALAFLRPPPGQGRSHVNHKDEDKENNTVTNLEYVTPAENVAHYWKNRTEHRCMRGSSAQTPRLFGAELTTATASGH